MRAASSRRCLRRTSLAVLTPNQNIVWRLRRATQTVGFDAGLEVERKAKYGQPKVSLCKIPIWRCMWSIGLQQSSRTIVRAKVVGKWLTSGQSMISGETSASSCAAGTLTTSLMVRCDCWTARCAMTIHDALSQNTPTASPSSRGYYIGCRRTCEPVCLVIVCVPCRSSQSAPLHDLTPVGLRLRSGKTPRHMLLPCGWDI